MRTKRAPRRDHYGRPGHTISAEVQADIVRRAQSGETRNGIARELGIAAASVSGICKRAGVTFDRTQVAAATSARTADNRARRAEVAALLLDDALRLREQLWEQHEYIEHGGKEFKEARWIQDEPSPADKLKLMQATATALGRHMDLDQHDAERPDAAVSSMLRDVGRMFGLIPDEQPEPADAG